MTNTVTRSALTEKMNRGDSVTLLEALPAMYYRKEHLPGAINFPHDEVDELAPRLLPDRSAEIVVYCASSTCANSGLAAERLLELGYTNVSVYEGGKQDWIEAGLPVERGLSGQAA